MAEDKSKEAKDAAKQAEAASAGRGGFKAMLPLILTVVLMPVLAFAMTQFVLVPKLQKAIFASAATTGHGDGTEGEASEGGHAAEQPPAEESGDHGEAAKGGKGGDHGDGEAKPVAKGAKTLVPLPKVIVNVKDTQATRYLMSSYTLVGKGEEFKTLIESNMEQVRDVAATVLSMKSIQDLEKPDVRNVIKSELISSLNTALGKPAVKEIYITDFAIQ